MPVLRKYLCSADGAPGKPAVTSGLTDFRRSDWEWVLVCFKMTHRKSSLRKVT